MRRLHALRLRSREKREFEAARNDLESFIIEGKDRLYQQAYEAASTETEREELRVKLNDASDWLDEQDEASERKVGSIKATSNLFHLGVILAFKPYRFDT